jgi:hypothetical protein
LLVAEDQTIGSVNTEEWEEEEEKVKRKKGNQFKVSK